MPLSDSNKKPNMGQLKCCCISRWNHQVAYLYFSACKTTSSEDFNANTKIND